MDLSGQIHTLLPSPPKENPLSLLNSRIEELQIGWDALEKNTLSLLGIEHDASATSRSLDTVSYAYTDLYMCVCVYIYIYVYIYVYICVYIYICVCVCVYIYIYIYIYK